MRFFSALLFFSPLLISFSSYSQNQFWVDFHPQQKDDNQIWEYTYENPIVKKGFLSLGFGVGLPYGGLGFRSGYNVANRLNAFAGLGYNFQSVGTNIGLQYDFIVVKQTAAYLSAMGGYNGVTLVQGESEYNKTFYGPSFGLGIKVDSRKQSGSFLHLGVLYPMRSAAFDRMVDRIKDDPTIEGSIGPFPILLTFGYAMGLGDY